MTAEAATRASSAATRREYRRSAGRVRLRTLVLIRWVAVAGQGTAILVVHVGLGSYCIQGRQANSASRCRSDPPSWR